MAEFAQARDAIAEVLPQLTALIRKNRAVMKPVIGDWYLGDLAAHVSHVMRVDINAVTGGPLPNIAHPLSADRVSAMTTSLMAADQEREPNALADRLTALGEEFARADASERTVTWLAGMQLPASAVACHLLEELLVHGFDIAKGAGVPWLIDPAHAALVIRGAVVPVLSADPMTFLDADEARGFRARIEVRLRRFDSFVFAFDDGLTIESAPTDGADAHLSIEADQMLLVTLGRTPAWRPLVTGKAFAWGRRPDYLRKMMRVVVGP
jgi:hypothetical protein